VSGELVSARITDEAAAARVLVRLTSPVLGDVAVSPALVQRERQRIDLITAVAALPGLPPPDPADRYTARAVTVTWLERKSPHTQRGYLRELHDWLAWCERNRLDPLTARRADVDGWTATMTARARGADGTVVLAQPSNATIKHRMDAVSSWYEYLLIHERATRNPMKGATRPDPPDHSPLPVLDDEDYEPFLDWLDDRATTLGTETALRDAALLRMMFTLGLRVTGLCTAELSSLRRERRRTYLHYVKKGGQPGRVPVPPKVIASCERYWAVRAARENRSPATLRGPLFVSTPLAGQPDRTGGRALKQRDVQRILRRLATQADLDIAATITPHSGRATAATRALSRGAAPRAVQEMLGVKSLDTAMRYDRGDYTGDASAVYLLDPSSS
jgi:integrase/recombinase XerD